MKAAATISSAAVPSAKAAGAAEPAAWTANEILKAAVSVGAMTASDSPTAAGSPNARLNPAIARSVFSRCTGN
jgi:hypothetical protein